MLLTTNQTEESAAEVQNGPADKKEKKKTALIIVLIVLLTILLAAGIAVFAILHGLRSGENVPKIRERTDTYVIQTMEDTIQIIDPDEFANMTEPVTEELTEPAGTEAETQAPEVTPIYKQYKTDPDVMNILLLGRDARNAKVENGRTDSMIILSYNKRTHEVKLVSLMRDMLIPIEGHDWNRINTAYAFGGIGFCINTINDVFALDIQNYMTIDFTSLKNVIDSIGGVDVTLTPDEVALYQTYGMLGKNVSAGVVHLTGDQALRHARNRALGSDFERTRRQRDILIAIYKKVTSTMSLSEVTELISTVIKMVATNLPLTDLVSLAADVMANKNAISIETSRVPYNDTYNGAWYKGMLVIQIDIAENTRLLHETLYGE